MEGFFPSSPGQNIRSETLTRSDCDGNREILAAEASFISDEGITLHLCVNESRYLPEPAGEGLGPLWCLGLGNTPSLGAGTNDYQRCGKDGKLAAVDFGLEDLAKTKPDDYVGFMTKKLADEQTARSAD